MAIINTTFIGGGSLKVPNGTIEELSVANNTTISKNTFVGIKDEFYTLESITDECNILSNVKSNSKSGVVYVDEDTIILVCNYGNYLYWTKCTYSNGHYVTASSYQNVNFYTGSRATTMEKFYRLSDGNLLFSYAAFSSSLYNYYVGVVKYDKSSDTLVYEQDTILNSGINTNKYGKVSFGYDCGKYGNTSGTFYTRFFVYRNGVLTAGDAVTGNYEMAGYGAIKDSTFYYITDNLTLTSISFPTELTSNTVVQVSPFGNIFVGTSGSIQCFVFDKAAKTIIATSNPLSGESIDYPLIWHINAITGDFICATTFSSSISGSSCWFRRGKINPQTKEMIFEENWVDYYLSPSYSASNSYNATVVKSYDNGGMLIFGSLYDSSKINALCSIYYPTMVGRNRVFEIESSTDELKGITLEAGTGATEDAKGDTVKVYVPTVYAST